MPRKRGRPRVNAALQSKQEEPRDVNQEEDASSELIDLAERQGEAIRAFQAVQIEQLRTMLRLLRSSFSKEELSVPVLHFFSKNLPNVVLVRNKNDNACEVQWKKDDGSFTMEQLDQMHVPTSLLQRLSRMYSHRSSVIPPFDRFGFSNNSVKTCVFGAENLQIKGLVLEEPSENQLVDQQDPFQTPGGLCPSTKTQYMAHPLGYTRKTWNQYTNHKSTEQAERFWIRFLALVEEEFLFCVCI
ncbi:unnamed protein product [Cuscuta campestris]|uniref:Uncharacterized protein n=1 Tax=Cuscuta campestris TaxID=132261 RepID=A0A484KE78_9ASTE|nr:unnamed protein product [Cuscuta campestris]